jgi:hypothetical protein
MKRAAMISVGVVVGLAIAVAILVLFVHRPSECGEPAACGDDHIFPALYFSSAALASTVALAAIQGRLQSASWRRFLVGLTAWSALLGALMAAARGGLGAWN